MELTDRNSLYRAMLARDPRYDGRFYVGVRTTGIYCRPICPARPRLENVQFYRSPTEAEAAGFRPCLRCHPDLSPTSAQWKGTLAVIGRALALIERGAVDEGSIEALADRLGMSDRHLRRLFSTHLGASPLDVALSRRLHLAHQLLLQTPLPVGEVALAAGFQSIRRFNDAFKARFKVTPQEARRRLSIPAGDSSMLRLELVYSTPFDWAYLQRFLAHHAIAGVEDTEGEAYRRTFCLEGQVGWLEVRNDARHRQLVVEVDAPDVRMLRQVLERLRDLFDLRMNPALLPALQGAAAKPTEGETLEPTSESTMATDGLTASNGQAELPVSPMEAGHAGLLERNPGIRIPGAWDAFETAVCIILGQLVSLEAARRSSAQLVERFGTRLEAPPRLGLTHLFPSPAVLASADLSPLGLTRVKAGAIQALAKAVDGGEIDLSRACDLEATRAGLLAMRGIGPWTVEMVAMRCLGDSDAFPAKDLIIQRALELEALDAMAFSPFRAYAALAIWKEQATTLSRKSGKTRTS